MKVEEQLFNVLKNNDYHITFAESCTGGLACATLINVSGSSSVIDASFITYSNSSKVKILNVDSETINTKGVVSCEVALEMAKGAKEKTLSNIGVGITGVAGPNDDGLIKAGTVCFGLMINDDAFTFKEIFSNMNRQEVREESVRFIFNKIIEILTK